jgi:tRNA pseudouridine65 synthase
MESDAAAEPLPVLYLDEHLVVVNKPAGWLVHRSPLDPERTRVVLQRLRDQLGRHLWPLHRLDKGTSGTLILALDRETAERIGRSFGEAEGPERSYRAIVRGWPPDHLLIDHPLRRLADDRGHRRQEILPAQTRLRTLARGSLPIAQGSFPSLRWAEVALEPLTGRRHQLRRHMKHIAHPIIGDATHGKGPLNRSVAAQVGVQRLWLHAASLRLSDPWSGAPIVVNAPLGAQWQCWSEPARIDAQGPAVEARPQILRPGSTE